jgi:energy-converting hydrogenase Eha subunit B
VDAPPPLKRQKWRDAVLVMVIICLLILAVIQPRMFVGAMVGAVIGVFTLIRRYYSKPQTRSE